MKKTKTLSYPVILLLGSLAFLLSACPSGDTDSGPVNAEAAAAFIADAEAQLLESWIARERAAWVQETFITHDTNLLAAEASRRAAELTVRLAQEAARFSDLELDPDLERKLAKLKLSLVSPAPSDAEKSRELSEVEAAMKSRFAQGEYCPDGGDCMSIDDIIRTHAESRDADELVDVWQGWRTISKPMRAEFQRYAELANEGARELGFTDLGSMWRSKYDMPPEAFAAELDRLWEQVKPLYDALHCHVRARLSEFYGEDVVPASGPIPAHVLGNIWAQSWINVYDLAAPASVNPGYDLTELLRARGVDEREMVRYGERFFTSLGFDPLPDTFWERSLFSRPEGRDVVCHPSAWDLDWKDDLRIKMCIKIDAEDFSTIHHELGHNFYMRAYKDQPPIYTESANDGFHEAVGDTVALSVTPAYLVELGFIEEEPPADADIGLLLRMALDKVAFVPFSMVVDNWRWKVFSGEVTPADYNAAWWELRTKYQGVVPPVERSEADFDPGAKFHVPAIVPYTRYFLAHILQFQLHRALCEAAGNDRPLNRCSIYANAEAGERLAALLEMGSSRPWPEALEAATGQRDMDATAIVDYFAPLMEWLEEQNAGRTCGW